MRFFDILNYFQTNNQLISRKNGKYLVVQPMLENCVVFTKYFKKVSSFHRKSSTRSVILTKMKYFDEIIQAEFFLFFCRFSEGSTYKLESIKNMKNCVAVKPLSTHFQIRESSYGLEKPYDSTKRSVFKIAIFAKLLVAKI